MFVHGRDKILGTWVNQRHDLHRTRGLNSDPVENVGIKGRLGFCPHFICLFVCTKVVLIQFCQGVSKEVHMFVHGFILIFMICIRHED